MIKSKEELIEEIRAVVGDDTSDNVIALIENVSDTVTELETSDGEEWKQKYEENDKMWREKYISRFTEGTTEPTEPTEPTTEPTADDEEKEKTFEDLFEEEKEC